MKSYHTEIEIQEPIEKVWKVLTDFKAYLEWNPLVKTLKGTLAEGGQIKTYIIPLKRELGAELVEFRYPQALAWQGALIASWFLNVYHYYHLEKIDEQTCLLKHGEEFSGAFSWAVPNSILKKMTKVFEEHNEALKKRVEL